MLSLYQALKRGIRYLWLVTLSLWTEVAFAASGDNPFPNLDPGGNQNVIDELGKQMQHGMKYALLGGGIVMVLIGISVIVHRLREDSTNRDNGSFVSTLIIAAIAVTAGIILIGIGWKAAGTTIQPT